MSSAEPTREVFPPEMDEHRLAWLATEDEQGGWTLTQVEFAMDGGKIYTSLRRDSAALEQIVERPGVRISFGKGNLRVKGPWNTGQAVVLARGEREWARHLLARKYWRLRWFWGRGVLVEIRLMG